MNNQLEEKLQRNLTFLSQDENNLNLLIDISDLYIELNELELAQTYLDRAKKINSEACLGHQGLLYLGQSEFSKAKACFIEALTYTKNPVLSYNLALIHFINDDFKEALDVLYPLIEKEHYPEAKVLIARILHRQGDLNEAIELLEESLTHNTHDSEALGLLSLLYFDLNEEDLAEQASQQALVLDSENYDARLVDIMLRLMTQETNIEEIEALLQLSPKDSRVWFALGSTYMIQGDFDAAEKSLQKTIELFPEFYDSHITLAWCQLLNNHVQEAYETYQNAAQLADDIADAWGGLALISVLVEDFSTAEQLMNKANQIDPDCFLTQIASSLYSVHQSPQKAQQQLLETLQNKELPLSEKLAIFLSE